jgi:glutathionyl-hydroquinone reductase
MYIYLQSAAMVQKKLKLQNDTDWYIETISYQDMSRQKSIHFPGGTTVPVLKYKVRSHMVHNNNKKVILYMRGISTMSI